MLASQIQRTVAGSEGGKARGGKGGNRGRAGGRGGLLEQEARQQHTSFFARVEVGRMMVLLPLLFCWHAEVGEERWWPHHFSFCRVVGILLLWGVGGGRERERWHRFLSLPFPPRPTKKVSGRSVTCLAADCLVVGDGEVGGKEKES